MATNYDRLTDENRKRLQEIDAQILELQKERAKILAYKQLMFEEERDYFASKLPDFYINGSSSRHGKKRINPKYSALWTGTRTAALQCVINRNKITNDLSEEQISAIKRKIRELIDSFDEAIIKKGLLW